MFDNNNNRYAFNPEYKQYRQTNEMNYEVNNYMNPVNQYQYTENPLRLSALDNQLYSLQKTKRYIGMSNEKSKQDNIHPTTSSGRLILKERINENILHPNYLHLNSNRRNESQIINSVTNNIKYHILITSLFIF